jgi:hypothetical protein
MGGLLHLDNFSGTFFLKSVKLQNMLLINQVFCDESGDFPG